MRNTLCAAAVVLFAAGCIGKADKLQPADDTVGATTGSNTGTPTDSPTNTGIVDTPSVDPERPATGTGTANNGTVTTPTAEQPQQPAQPTYLHTWFVNGVTGSDSNPGDSMTSPFKTISRSLLAAGPGDRILVAQGNYRETVSIKDSVKDGTATAPILLQGIDHPVLLPTGSTWAMVYLEKKYWIIDGFEMNAEMKPHTAVGMGNGNNGSILRNNEIHHGSSGTAVDVYSGAVDSIIEGNLIHDWDQGNVDAHGINVLWETKNTTIRKNRIWHNSGDSVQCTGPEGETASGTETPADGLLIEDNDMSDDAEQAIDIKTCWNVIARRNYAHDYSRNGGTTFVIHMSAKNILFEDNVAVNIGRGLSLGGNRVGPMPAGVVIRRNKFKNMQIDAANYMDGKGFNVANCDHAVIANNTIIGNQGVGIFLGEGENGPSDTLTLENNIIDGAIPVKDGGYAPGLISRTNLFLSGAQIATPSGMRTLAQWQSSGADTGSMVAGAPLADATNWVPNTVAVNAGTAINGTAFCGLAPEIGAVELCPTAAGRHKSIRSHRRGK